MPTSISRLPSPSELPIGNSFEQALAAYAKLLSHPNPSNPQDLEKIAHQTITLSKLAQSVMHAASPALRTTADDLEKLLQSPLAIAGLAKNVSILTASEHYLQNPATAELGPLIQELCHNSFALGLMCNELTLLSSAIKNLSEPGKLPPEV